jgi:hypothetical protein
MGEGAGEDAAALVRRHRLAAGLSQRELAESAGMSVGVVRDLEQQRTSRLQARSAESLARALGLGPCQASSLARVARVPARARRADTPGGGRAGRARVRVAVLGPLAVWRDGVRAEAGPSAQCAVLGMLALAPNMLVRREAIIDVLRGVLCQNPCTRADLLVYARRSCSSDSYTCSWSVCSAGWPSWRAATPPRTRRSWFFATRSRCCGGRSPSETELG